MQARPLGQERPDFLATMGVEAIPDDKDLTANVTQQVAEKGDHLLLANGLVGMKVQQPAQASATRRNSNAADERNVTVMACSGADDRSLAARRPSATHKRCQENACFVDENEGAAAASGLFLRRGQSRSIQVRMAFSSRSRAVRSGRCTEKPKRFSKWGR